MVSHLKNTNSKRNFRQQGWPKGRNPLQQGSKILDEKITVNINGRPEKLTKEDAFLKEN